MEVKRFRDRTRDQDGLQRRGERRITIIYVRGVLLLCLLPTGRPTPGNILLKVARRTRRKP